MKHKRITVVMETWNSMKQSMSEKTTKSTIGGKIHFFKQMNRLDSTFKKNSGVKNDGFA